MAGEIQAELTERERVFRIDIQHIAATISGNFDRAIPRRI
jgi:hypothetical protein